MIDLHLHTTASDGTLSPGGLVDRARAAGLTVISLTDHDTVAGVAEALSAAAAAGLRVVPGIEITAIEHDRDVHVLGYFFDPESAPLGAFLARQRAARLARVAAIAEKLAALGHPVDVDQLLECGRSGIRSIGRPAIADALVASGAAASRDDAFERLLRYGRPAFVPRAGVAAREVISIIHDAGGLASLAHPGVLAEDGLIGGLVEAGLDAIEVWHSDHSAAQRTHYGELAGRFGLARSGGSDFHGDGVHRAAKLGDVTMPADAFAALEARSAGR